MFNYVFFLLIGFTSNSASAFTAFYSRHWGRRWGAAITVLLRDVFGIPIWGIGFILSIRSSSTTLFHPSMIIRICGWSIIAIGASIIVIALAKIRIKAAAPTAQDRLVRTGLYGRMRHPIHTGTFLEFVGLFFKFPKLSVGIACMLGILWILIQTKCEESDLMKRMPEYREYMKRVPRYFPHVGR